MVWPAVFYRQEAVGWAGRQTTHTPTTVASYPHTQPPPLCHRFLALAEDLQPAGTSKHDRWRDRKINRERERRQRREQAVVTSSGRVSGNEISWQDFKVV